MSKQAFDIGPQNYPEPHSVVGVDVMVLASKEATGGYEITLQIGNEGSGPPPHAHPWDESFFVVKGEVDFTYEDKTSRAVAGTFFHLPAGTVHGFRICEDGTTMMEITGEGSQSIAMFKSISEEVAPGIPQSTDVPKIVEILGRFGATLEK